MSEQKNTESEISRERIDEERQSLVKRLEGWLETPLLILGFVWLILLIVELTGNLSPALEVLATAIWIIFIVDFAIKFSLAPGKIAYLKTNWLTALSLLVPALRVFRIFRVFRVLRAARAVRGVRLFRVLTSLNRGMKSLGASFGRRGFGYVVALSAIVVFAGAAGMLAFENEFDGGLQTYGDALWWTAMMITTIGSDLLSTFDRRPRPMFLTCLVRVRGIRLCNGHACNLLRRARCGEQGIGARGRR